MKKNNVKIAACAMAAVIAFGGTGLDASASGNVASVLPSAGIDFSIQDSEKTTALSKLQEESDKEAAQQESNQAAGVTVGNARVGGYADLASASDTISKTSRKKIEDTIVVSEGYTKDLKEAAGSGL